LTSPSPERLFVFIIEQAFVLWQGEIYENKKTLLFDSD